MRLLAVFSNMVWGVIRLASLEAGEKDDVEFQKWKEEMIMVRHHQERERKRKKERKRERVRERERERERER